MKTVNKIVASLLAAASFPLLITQLFINIVLSVDKDSTAYTLINSLFGSDNLFPLAPDDKRNEPILAARPTQIVDTSHLI